MPTPPSDASKTAESTEKASGVPLPLHSVHADLEADHVDDLTQVQHMYQVLDNTMIDTESECAQEDACTQRSSTEPEVGLTQHRLDSTYSPHASLAFGAVPTSDITEINKDQLDTFGHKIIETLHKSNDQELNSDSPSVTFPVAPPVKIEQEGDAGPKAHHEDPNHDAIPIHPDDGARQRTKAFVRKVLKRFFKSGTSKQCVSEHAPDGKQCVTRTGLEHDDEKQSALENAAITSHATSATRTNPSQPVAHGSETKTTFKGKVFKKLNMPKTSPTPKTAMGQRVLSVFGLKTSAPAEAGRVRELSCVDADIVFETFNFIRQGKCPDGLGPISPDRPNAELWADQFNPVTGKRLSPDPFAHFFRAAVDFHPSDFLSGVAYWLHRRFGGEPLVAPAMLVKVGRQMLASRKDNQQCFGPEDVLASLQQDLRVSVKGHCVTMAKRARKAAAKERWLWANTIMCSFRHLYGPQSNTDCALAEACNALLCMQYKGGPNQASRLAPTGDDRDIYANVTNNGVTAWKDLLTAYQLPELGADWTPCHYLQPVYFLI